MRYDKHSADTLGYQHAKNMQSVNNFSVSLFAGTIQPMHTGKGVSFDMPSAFIGIKMGFLT